MPHFLKSRWFRKWGLPITVLLCVLVAAPWLIGPPVPDKVVIATGSADGAYVKYAEKYREVLAREGVELEIRTTAGSVDNLALLESDGSDVSIAFMQGGIGSGESHPGIQSLCSLYSEPVWVFYRPAAVENESISSLGQLRGHRVAVGKKGSGTRAAALQLLHVTGVVDGAGKSDPSSLISLGGSQAAEALRRGEVDAAFFVIAPKSPIVRQLLEDPDVVLFDFQHTAAFENRFPFFSTVTLPTGIIDIEQSLPARDVTLLAPTANMVARSDLHPALVPLFMKACYEVHESGNWLNGAGDFPSAKHVTFELNDNAKRYLRSGPSPLYKYLPFWLAAWLNQMKLLMVPLATLLLPLFKVAPPLYRWRIRWKIFRWYRVLRTVDQNLERSESDWDVEQDIQRLRQVESELAGVSVPLSYMAEAYTLRQHLDFVLVKLRERQRQSAQADQRRAA